MKIDNVDISIKDVATIVFVVMVVFASYMFLTFRVDVLLSQSETMRRTHETDITELTTETNILTLKLEKLTYRIREEEISNTRLWRNYQRLLQDIKDEKKGS